MLRPTKRLKAAGGLLGIQLLDHVVLTDSARVSLRERGDLSGRPTFASAAVRAIRWARIARWFR